jgi:hypothetical protein
VTEIVNGSLSYTTLAESLAYMGKPGEKGTLHEIFDTVMDLNLANGFYLENCPKHGTEAPANEAAAERRAPRYGGQQLTATRPNANGVPCDYHDLPHAEGCPGSPVCSLGRTDSAPNRSAVPDA